MLLVGKVRQDAQGASAAIYEEVKDHLVRFATSLVGPSEAPDVVSTVVLRTLRRGSLDRLSNPRTYLMRAVRNECRSHHRKRRRDDSRPVLGAPPSEIDPDDALDVVGLVRALPERQRTATLLVYWGDLTPSEAAQIMQVRAATLRRYLHLARKKMKEALDVGSD